MVVAALVICFLTGLGWTQDPLDFSAGQKRQPEEPCTSFPAQELGPREIPVIGVSFSGNLQMPVADQSRIAGELKQLTYSEALDGAADELLERVRLAWQDRGFFQVEVSGDAILTSRGADRGLALNAQINEGPQYRLGRISFQHNRTLTDVEHLRALFRLKDDDAFSRSRVAEGLDNLRKAYGEYGFINYTGVPKTRIDNEKHKIYVVVDIDEGKQFYVDSIEVLGLDDANQQALLRESSLRGGDIYNARLDELFLGRIKSQFPNCGCGEIKHNQIDERAGTAVLTYDLRSCAAGK